LITAVLAFGASLFTYNIARPATGPTASGASIALASLGLVVAISALFGMIIINDGLVRETYVSMAYVLCFVGIALTIGWGSGRLLG
jgi:hypothetical protein